MVALAGHNRHSSVTPAFTTPSSGPRRAGLLEGGRAGELEDPCHGPSSVYTLT